MLLDPLTRVHWNLLYCSHRTQLWHAHFPPSDEVVLLDSQSQSVASRWLVRLVSILTHRQREGLLRIELLPRSRVDLLVLGEELVLPCLWLMHPPDEGLVSSRGGSLYLLRDDVV